MRLGDMRLTEGHYADAAMYYEMALKLDPMSEWTRRSLISTYVAMSDMVAARQVADTAPHPLPIQRLTILMHEGDWHQAAQVSYAALSDDTMMPITESWSAFAFRIDARRSGDYRPARAALEKMCGVSWSSSGIPTLPMQLGLASASIALGDVLIAGGDRTRGERLLRASLADLAYVTRDLKRGDLWYLVDEAIALALLGDRKGSLAILERARNDGNHSTMWPIRFDPAFETLHADPEFKALVLDIDQKQAFERQQLQQLRAAGRIPVRSGPTAVASAPH
jgi:tetratricopeptide (TPR) repeat protein